MKKACLILSTLLILIIAFVYTSTRYSIGVVVSDSMIPTLYRGDVVIIGKVDREIQRLDIITFRDSYNELVVHRVEDRRVDKDGNVCYITKGDANYTIDRGVRYQNEVDGILIKAVQNEALRAIVLNIDRILILGYIIIAIIGLLVVIKIGIDDIEISFGSFEESYQYISLEDKTE